MTILEIKGKESSIGKNQGKIPTHFKADEVDLKE